jgi:hypothetical protein
VQRLIADHFDEAADYVEVLRRLWDSWEDEAEIRPLEIRSSLTTGSKAGRGPSTSKPDNSVFLSAANSPLVRSGLVAAATIMPSTENGVAGTR